MEKSIYTIGYGNRNIEDFITILKSFGIEVLVDVRTNPQSRFRPAYNKIRLKEELERNQIAYNFQGAELGGLPKDLSLYTDDNPDYLKIRKTKLYKQGIESLEEIISKDLKLAIMCAELDYKSCHRHNLIGLDMEDLGYTVNHIAKDGNLEPKGLF